MVSSPIVWSWGMNQGRFLGELKRLEVFRIALACLVWGWPAPRVVDVVIGNIGAAH